MKRLIELSAIPVFAKGIAMLMLILMLVVLIELIIAIESIKRVLF